MWCHVKFITQVNAIIHVRYFFACIPDSPIYPRFENQLIPMLTKIQAKLEIVQAVQFYCFIDFMEQQFSQDNVLRFTTFNKVDLGYTYILS